MAERSKEDPRPPVNGVTGRPTSPVSEMTTPSSGGRRHNSDQERINDTLLSDLVCDIDEFSPMRRLFAAEEQEEMYDRQAYTENPGAEPSQTEITEHAKELKRVLQPAVVQLQETEQQTERPTVPGGTIV